jgi:hypothetical protein
MYRIKHFSYLCDNVSRFVIDRVGFGRGRPRGPMKAAYEPDSQKRSNKQCARKNGLVRKCSELAVITGASVFFRLVTLEGKSYVYSSCDDVYEEYASDKGLRSLGAKEIRIDENAKEIAKDAGKTDKDAKKNHSKENGTAGGVGKKEKTKEKKEDSGPKVIEITPDNGGTGDAPEQVIKAPKPKIGRPKKDAKKVPASPQVEPQQQSFTIETNSSDFLNPSLQTLHIDKKFVISSADVLEDNSLSIQDNEGVGVINEDSSNSVPVVLFPNQPAFQLDPSLVSNGSTAGFIPVSVPVSVPVSLDPKLSNPQKKKRKPRKRSESPEAKKEKVDVKCNTCGELYAKRQDNRRYGRWIGCSACPVWVHAKCVGWTEADVDSAKDYFCADCLKKKEESEKAADGKGDGKAGNGKTDAKGGGKSPNKKDKEAKSKTENPKKKRKVEKDDSADTTKTEVSSSMVESTDS